MRSSLGWNFHLLSGSPLQVLFPNFLGMPTHLLESLSAVRLMRGGPMVSLLTMARHHMRPKYYMLVSRGVAKEVLPDSNHWRSIKVDPGWLALPTPPVPETGPGYEPCGPSTMESIFNATGLTTWAFSQKILSSYNQTYNIRLEQPWSFGDYFHRVRVGGRVRRRPLPRGQFPYLQYHCVSNNIMAGTELHQRP